MDFGGSLLLGRVMIDKTYEPGAVEGRIYEAWQKAGAFKAGAGAKPGGEPFSIVIPPPNVTGNLHVGHALNNTIQDVLTRFNRMRGRDVLWQPGTDHAGIATQMIVERQLAERQQNRRDMGREKFVERVWEWKAESGGAIINQLKRLGASADWSRERFTLGEHGEPDDQMVRAVTKVFVALYNKGLIYRDVWFSEKSGKQFSGRTAIEMGTDNRVVKEVFFFDAPLPNTPDGAVDAVGIALNLLPPKTPQKFVDSGRRAYEHGWVLWFDYGSGRYVNFFLNQEETQIEAVVGGIEATNI